MWCNLFNSQSPLENFWMTWDSLFFLIWTKLLHYYVFIINTCSYDSTGDLSFLYIGLSHFLTCNWHVIINCQQMAEINKPLRPHGFPRQTETIWTKHLNVFSQKMNKLFLLRKKLEIPRHSVNFVILDQSFSFKNCDMSSLPFILRMHVCCTYRCSISFHKPRL